MTYILAASLDILFLLQSTTCISGSTHWAKRKTEGAPRYSVEEMGELENVHTAWREDGSANLTFTSHGRKHSLDLVQSKLNLANVPVKILGSSEQFQQQVKQQVKSLNLMKDSKNGGFIAFKKDETQSEPELSTGIYRFRNKQYSIRHTPTGHEAFPTAKLSHDNQSKGKHRAENTRESSRQKRDTSLPISLDPEAGNVELVWIIDYSVVNSFSSRTATELSELENPDHAVNIMTYFAHLTSIMDTYFGTMENGGDVKLSVSLAGLVLLTKSTEMSDLVEDHQIKGRIESNGVLGRMSNWLGTEEAQDVMPPYDHVMLATNYNVYDESDGYDSVSGFAYKGKICNKQDSVSMIEVDDVLSITANLAAHELGHSLGASHDGEGNAFSCPKERYLMDPAVGDGDRLDYRYLFSCCSQKAFYTTLRLQGDCLKNDSAVPNYDSSIDVNVEQNLPGEVFLADDQCYISLGTEACGQWVYDRVETDLCANLYCVIPDDPLSCQASGAPAVDGTRCGASKWCLQGACVDKSEQRPVTTETCDVTGDGCYTYTCIDTGMCVTSLEECKSQCPDDPRCLTTSGSYKLNCSSNILTFTMLIYLFKYVGSGI